MSDLQRISRRVVQATFDISRIRGLLGGGNRAWFSGESRDLAHKLLYSLDQDLRRLDEQKEEVKRLSRGGSACGAYKEELA